MDFDALRIRLASPDEIRAMSHGEVKKSETVNYRTNRPEPDGLFCEKIFGPIHDYECACGKYKGRKYEGQVCERCGVEVTRSSVRRERMGHIELGTPIVHPWFFRNAQSRLGFMVDMKQKDLERVIYYTSNLATDTGPDILPRLTAMSSESALDFSFWFLGQKLVFQSVADVQGIPQDRLELAGTPDFSSGLTLLESVLADIYSLLSENVRTYSQLSIYKTANYVVRRLNELISEKYQVPMDIVKGIWKNGSYVLYGEGGFEFITMEQYLMLLPNEQERVLTGVRAIAALVASENALLDFVAEQLERFPTDIRRIASNPLATARHLNKADFLTSVKEPVFMNGSWLSFEEARELYSKGENISASNYMSRWASEIFEAFNLRRSDLLSKGAAAADNPDKQYLLGKMVATTLNTGDFESTLSKIISGAYAVVPYYRAKVVSTSDEINKYKVLARGLSLALENLVVVVQRIREVLDQRNLSWDEQRPLVEDDVRFILKALSLEDMDIDKMLDGGYEVVNNFGYFTVMPREGQSMEDVLRNACSMVLKDILRLLDRVQDYDILIDDDKDRALQVIKHVLGVELTEGMDLKVIGYDLKLVHSLRPISQEQVWEILTLLLSEAFVKDNDFATEVFNKLGYENSGDLFKKLSDQMVVSTSFVAPRVNALDLLSDEEAEAYRLLIDVEILRNEEPLLKTLTGGEAIKELLKKNYSPDKLQDWVNYLVEQLEEATGQKKQKITKRLQVINGFLKSKTDPAWMVLEVLPVLPPDLRPLIFDKNERAKSSDLNELYRRIINRNLRLKRLREQKAPDLIIRNEMRLLQEAVEALIDNSRKDKPVKDSRGRQLKSLTDKLSGKQGRFRQNLLGKRVDYSGRSVIVIGPDLKLNQTGIPRIMAAELFKPMLIGELQRREIASTAKQAKKMIESYDPRIWPVLADIVKGYYVLLNRAPTLHRPSIEAFEPVLVDSKAISVPPMICPPFNADFDGDQMAVHVPLSNQALAEARLLMSSHLNILSPAHGEPLAAPTQDLVIGPYFLTVDLPGSFKGDGNVFYTAEDVEKALSAGKIDIHAHIWYVPLMNAQPATTGNIDRTMTGNTTVGRVIFNNYINQRLAENNVQSLPYANDTMTKKSLYSYINDAIDRLGLSDSIYVLDAIKEIGFKYATLSGLTISALDLSVVPSKNGLVEEAREKIETIEQEYNFGRLTVEERYEKIVNIWRDVVDKVTDSLNDYFDESDHLYMMFTSGARGNKDQVRQLIGLRGLMADPTGKIIEYPIIDSLLEGLTIQEYFVSTHGARKGQADTALKTADAGYLTRRLVDVVQSVTITEDDHSVVSVGPNTYDNVAKALVGRFAEEDIRLPGEDEPVVRKGQVIGVEEAQLIAEAGIEVLIRRDMELVKVADLLDPDNFVYGLNHANFVLPGELRIGDEVLEKGRKVTPSLAYRLKELGVEDLIVRREDGLLVRDLEATDGSDIADLGSRVWGRFAAEDILDPNTGAVLVKAGQEITAEDAQRIDRAGVRAVRIHSPITCLSEDGICVTCYGRDLSRRRLVEKGESVGVVAAQSIGEPGTQLTLRTFHTGGVAGEDITGGLPRVEELFEARKKNALTEIVMPLQDFFAVFDGAEQKIQRYVSNAMESFVGELDNVLKAHLSEIDDTDAAKELKKVVRAWFSDLSNLLSERLSQIRHELLRTYDWDGLELSALTRSNEMVEELYGLLDRKASEFERLFMDALKSANLEEHMGSLSGHFRDKLSNVQATLRSELFIVPWYVAVATGIKGGDPAELKNFYANYLDQLHTGDVDFAFDIDAKRPTKKSKLLAMSPISGIVHDVSTVIDHGQEMFTIVVVKQGNSFGAFVTNAESRKLRIRHEDIGSKYILPGYRLVFDSLDASLLLRAFGQDAAVDYLIGEIKSVYASQKVEINDKHFEVVLKQMFSKVVVDESGDSVEMLPGDVVEWSDFEQEVRFWTMQGKKAPKGHRVCMGVTKVSKSSKSWLAAASFQETPQVLVDAAIAGKVDKLRGLKENVIIARRIPAGTGIYKEEDFIIE
jgi:DNA-directed RNA polymerase subunit beta'